MTALRLLKAVREKHMLADRDLNILHQQLPRPATLATLGMSSHPSQQSFRCFVFCHLEDDNFWGAGGDVGGYYALIIPLLIKGHDSKIVVFKQCQLATVGRLNQPLGLFVFMLEQSKGLCTGYNHAKKSYVTLPYLIICSVLSLVISVMLSAIHIWYYCWMIISALCW